MLITWKAVPITMFTTTKVIRYTTTKKKNNSCILLLKLFKVSNSVLKIRFSNNLFLSFIGKR